MVIGASSAPLKVAAKLLRTAGDAARGSQVGRIEPQHIEQAAAKSGWVGGGAGE